jgi:hypothetical protein
VDSFNVRWLKMLTASMMFFNKSRYGALASHIPTVPGFMYLVVIIDWYSYSVMAGRYQIW